jgi:hypothetical protein
LSARPRVVTADFCARYARRNVNKQSLSLPRAVSSRGASRRGVTTMLMLKLCCLLVLLPTSIVAPSHASQPFGIWAWDDWPAYNVSRFICN